MSAEDDLILGAIAGVPRLVMQLHRGEVTPAELYRRALGGERAAESVLRAAASCGDEGAREMVEALRVARSGKAGGSA